MAVTLIAFWSYDKYPYLLSGRVLQMDSTGRVEVEGYPSYKFDPLYIIPAPMGREVQQKLNALQEEYEAANAALLKEFGGKAGDLFTPYTKTKDVK